MLKEFFFTFGWKILRAQKNELKENYFLIFNLL